MTERSWLDEERRFGELSGQAARLFRHGFRRPWALVIGALILAALLVGSVVLARQSYEPRIVLRVVEANADPTSMPELKRRLADYVRDGVFTSEPLLELAHRYGLYPKASDRRATVDAFRRDIEVDVYQNYFVEQRTEGETPRSARVAVSYRGSNRATAVAVTRELGALVVARVRATREDQAARAAKAAQNNAATLEQALVDRYGAIANAERRLAAGWDPADQVAIVSLTGSLPALERNVTAAERRAGSLALGAAYEARGVGLTFDVAEDASVALADRKSTFRLLASAAVFLCGLPFVVLAAGAGLLSKGTT